MTKVVGAVGRKVEGLGLKIVVCCPNGEVHGPTRLIHTLVYLG